MVVVVMVMVMVVVVVNMFVCVHAYMCSVAGDVLYMCIYNYVIMRRYVCGGIYYIHLSCACAVYIYQV